MHATTPWERLLGAAMVAAPILLLLSSIAFAAGGGIDDDQLGGVIQVYAATAFALAFIGLGRMVEEPYPQGSAVLALIGVVGAIGGASFGIVSINSDLTGVHLQDFTDASIQLGLLLPGILFAPALIGLGVALRRARIGPAMSATALIVGAVLFPISRIGSVEALAIGADLVLVLGLVPLGMSAFRSDAAAPQPIGDGARG